MKRRPKIVIIGWDGATFDVALPLMAQGKLPNLKKVLDSGAHGRLTSTIPPITPAAWITLMLGVSQGRHGVFDFTKPVLRVPGEDFSVETGRTYCEGRSFWELMEKQDGARSAILFVPMTYPVWRTNGMMVAGIPVGSMKRDFLFPGDQPNRFEDCFIGKDFYKLQTLQKDRYKEISLNVIDRRGEEIVSAIQSGDYDLIFGVFGGSDRAIHIFWRFREPDNYPNDPEEQSKFANAIDEHYIRMDENLGRIIESISDDTLLCLVSDHGAGPKGRRCFHLNRWLLDNGYFRERKVTGKRLFRRIGRFMRWNPVLRRIQQALPGFATRGMRKISSSLDAIDFESSRAFRSPIQFYYDGVEINLKGRQTNGIVEETEYEALRDELIQRLLDAKDPDTGKRVVVSARKKEEFFDGEGAAFAPDIIVEYDDLYEGDNDVEHLVHEAPFEILKNLSGSHRLHGIFALMGCNIKPSVEIDGTKIDDLTPTLLYALGYTIPMYMTGRILTDTLKDEFVRANPPKFSDEEYSPPGTGTKVGDSESERMREQLRGLGYIE